MHCFCGTMLSRRSFQNLSCMKQHMDPNMIAEGQVANSSAETPYGPSAKTPYQGTVERTQRVQLECHYGSGSQKPYHTWLLSLNIHSGTLTGPLGGSDKLFIGGLLAFVSGALTMARLRPSHCKHRSNSGARLPLVYAAPDSWDSHNAYLQDSSVRLQRLLASETTRLSCAFGGMSKGDGQQGA